MVTTTKYIGSDPSDDYTTIALWAADRRGSVGDGDTEEAVLRSEAHLFNTTFGVFQGWNEVDYKILFRGAESHGGDWDSGATLSSTARVNISQRNQTVDYEFRDLVFIVDQGSYGFLYQHISNDGLGDAYSGSVLWDRCLVTTVDQSTGNTFSMNRHHLENSTTSALGTFAVRTRSCVFDLGGRDLVATLAGSTFRNNSLFEVIGCTFRSNGNGLFSTRGYGDTFEAFVSGSTYHNESIYRPIFGNETTSGVAVDYITHERIQTVNAWADTKTNVTYQAGFNYDNTVTTGEACFIGPSGYKGNYKLVDDTDNLAVDYVTNADLSNITDVANNSRGTSPFDAGAYQIVADAPITLNFGNVYINLYN